MKKIKIAIISGGPSSEHEVSLKTAKNVIRALDLNKYEILHIRVSKEGVWVHEAKNLELSEEEGLAQLKKENVDLVFITVHGEYGEDGTLQRLLEKHKIKYTGSNSKVSGQAMDKVVSSNMLATANLNIPSFVSVNHSDWSKDTNRYINLALKSLGLPLVIKPTDRGSSVGIEIVKEKNRIIPAANKAFKFSENIMLQKFIKGRELTCAVLEVEKKKNVPLIPTEIIPDENHDFFDYNAKYKPGASIEVTPPDLAPNMIKKIQEEALKVHSRIGCKGVSRSDFILNKDTLYILEVNTIPGMTETSLLPQGAKAMGIEFSALIETIIKVELDR